MPTRILVVDDNKLMRVILNDILVTNGYQVAGEAIDGMDAIDKYHQLKPDLTIMDVILPFKNGIETTREIMIGDPAAKVIVCSSLGRNIMVDDALGVGAKEYITKPFKAADVVKAVKKALASSQ